MNVTFHKLENSISLHSVGDDEHEENTSNLTLMGIGQFISVAEQEEYNEKLQKKGLGVVEFSRPTTSNPYINARQKIAQQQTESEKKRVKEAIPDFPYIQVPVMTSAEKQLFYFLSNNLDQRKRVLIFPKVRLADIIKVDDKITRDNKYFYKICNKHVDFAICDYETLDLICVVELDDFTHATVEAQERDVFVMQALYTAGIETARIRVPIRTIVKKDIEYLDNIINTKLAPSCSEHGIKMITRKSYSKKNFGHRFYSCPYPNCNCTIDID